MVSSLTYLGHAKDAVHVFQRMLQQGVQLQPDGIAFLEVLCACSH
jgi:pentatricopeptide repeat protein